MNVEKCKQWANERISPTPHNPLTNRKIKKDGPKYKELDRDCKDLIVDLNPICMKWLKENHNDLYLQLNKPKVQIKPKPKPKPKIKPVKPIKVSVTPVVAQETKRDINDLITSDEEFEKAFYNISERQEFNDAIKNYFSTVIIEDGKACMTENKTLLRYVVDPKLLGYGSFGNVYGVKIPNSSLKVAIKEGRITAWEFKHALNKKYPMEYLYNKLINDLIDDKICPNFTFTYAIFFCDSCSVKTIDKTVKTKCSETVVELFSYTLDKLADLRDEVILSILFQVLFGLATIQIEYGMFHNDIKKENILIKEIPAGGYWNYYINNIKYSVPNYGYLAAINDFGVSIAYKPGFSEKNYGRRDAEVLRDPITNDYYFRPFTTENYAYIDKTGKIIKAKASKKRDGFTHNVFFKNFDSKPSINVDLNDMVRFPAYYFHFDIIDAIYMIKGGKRTGQPGDHRAMRISNKVKDILDPFYMVKIPEGWPIKKVDMFLAHVAIQKLFPFYRNLKVAGPLIEDYRLIFQDV